MGDPKKWKGLWEFSKNESRILLLSDSWLAWDWHATSFLLAAHITKRLLLSLPRCDTSLTTYTPCLSEWLTSVGLTCSSVSTWTGLAGLDPVPCHLRPSRPTAPSPGHRDTDGPESSHLRSHFLPNAPWALQWGLQWGKGWWTSLRGHSASISRPCFL